MSEVFLPSYAKIPNGPHEPNPSPRGVMVVDEPYKMMKTLMKMAKPQVKTKSPKGHRGRMGRRSLKVKESTLKWY